jgi:hypothetical protein
MPDNLLQTGGAGGIGVIVGAVLGFFGIKSRLETLERKIVGKDTCDVVQRNFHDLVDAQNEMLKEIRTDIKAILKNGNK